MTLVTREEYLKNLIKEHGYSLKDFAAKIGIPYTTLLSIVNSNVGGASVSTVIKICEALNIPVEQLKTDTIDDENPLPKPTYYLNAEVAAMAQEIYENPEYKVLFDASRKLKPEDVELVKGLLDRMGGEEEDQE